MNARWVPSVALAPGLRSRSDCFGGVGKGGTLRPSPSEVGYGRRRPEGSALRGVWRGATAVRPWGSTPTSFCIQSAEVHPLFRSNHVLCVAHPCRRRVSRTHKSSTANLHVRVVPPFVLDRGFETHGFGLPRYRWAATMGENHKLQIYRSFLGGEGRESNPPGTLRPPDWF